MGSLSTTIAWAERAGNMTLRPFSVVHGIVYEDEKGKVTGTWNVHAQMMGETIPKESNMVTLDKEQKDARGIPQLHISVDYDENEDKMIKDFFEQMTEMYTKAGFTGIRTTDSNQAPGLDIHEMGGVRMGRETRRLRC